MRDSSRETHTDAGEAGTAAKKIEGVEARAAAPESRTGAPTPSLSPQAHQANRGGMAGLGDGNAAPAPQSRWRRPLLIAGPTVLVIGGLWLYLATGRYVSEEDAYIHAVNVSISPQAPGQVVSVAAKSNTPVKKDEPLFKIDPEPYRIALANTNAQLGIARDQVETLIQNYRSRLTQIDQAKAMMSYAQTNFDREQELYQRGAGTRAALDAAVRDLDVAKANLASLQRDAAAALAQLGGNPDLSVDQQPLVRQAQAAVDVAARNLRLTEIVAPFDGIPNNVESIAVGAFLNAGQSAFPLVSTNDLYIEANIKETDLTYVKEGDPARVTIDAYPDASFVAKVATLAPASGSIFALLPPQNATGNWVKIVQRVPVRLSIDQAADSPALRAGMSVKVSIDTGHERSLRELWRDIPSIFGG
ncbi:membrane fusion protein, multidrug efflux system [Rhizobiales bacterium GAS113]|nr:membrane fusion protein, multidrug efflux system [Rhizobiales bacterium GAS113]